MPSYPQLIASLLGFAAMQGVAHAGSITVYSALESDEIATYLDAAHKALPDIDIHVLRLSSGDLAARLIAESAQPRNDVVWGMAVTDMQEPRIAALLTPVHSKNIDAMPSAFRASDARWFAPTGYLAALCVNRKALAERGLPAPPTLERPGRSDVPRPDRHARSRIVGHRLYGAFIADRQRQR